MLSCFVPPACKREADIGDRLSMCMERLGPFFIKLGQALSMRPDAIGYDIADKLVRFRDNMSPFDSKIAISIVESELKCKIEDVFMDFCNEAVSAASVAQVHRAKLFNGDDVAVKIIRPGIVKKFKRDINLFKWLSGIMHFFFKKSKRLKLFEVIDVIDHHRKFELNMQMEAANCSEIRENSLNDRNCYIPKVYWEYTSENILVMEWVEGVPLTDKSLDKKFVINSLVSIFCNQAYRDGVFHGDMHMGNLMFDKSRNKIVMIDFGIVGRLNSETKLYVAEIFRGFLNKDYRHVAKIHFEAGYVDSDQDDFVVACRALGESIVDKPAAEISLSKFLTQLFRVTADFNMQTQPQLLLLQKGTLIFEGLCMMVEEKVNIWYLARGWMSEWVKDNVGFKAKIRRDSCEMLNAFSRVPNMIKRIDKLLKKYEHRKSSNKSVIITKYFVIILLTFILYTSLLFYVS